MLFSRQKVSHKKFNQKTKNRLVGGFSRNSVGLVILLLHDRAAFPPPLGWKRQSKSESANG
ncbi:MAG: hypothetical protein H7234_01940 [Herminiimonas sp.]|nr:hypothetical protein [Herminiimonas sp.]